jgi:hypothetical protein
MERLRDAVHVNQETVIAQQFLEPVLIDCSQEFDRTILDGVK